MRFQHDYHCLYRLYPLSIETIIVRISFIFFHYHGMMNCFTQTDRYDGGLFCVASARVIHLHQLWLQIIIISTGLGPWMEYFCLMASMWMWMVQNEMEVFGAIY